MQDNVVNNHHCVVVLVVAIPLQLMTSMSADEEKGIEGKVVERAPECSTLALQSHYINWVGPAGACANMHNCCFPPVS
jgi:hypothetical protein